MGQGGLGEEGSFLLVGCWGAHRDNREGGSQHWAPKLKVGGLGSPKKRGECLGA